VFIFVQNLFKFFVSPDDIVCLVAGITDISLKEFMKIVLLLKFWSVATYSYLMLYLFQLFGRWFCCLFVIICQIIETNTTLNSCK
jgi:uncharacterized membrane protein YdjX (TVP38/TMEM64 family)